MLTRPLSNRPNPCNRCYSWAQLTQPRSFRIGQLKWLNSVKPEACNCLALDLGKSEWDPGIRGFCPVALKSRGLENIRASNSQHSMSLGFPHGFAMLEPKRKTHKQPEDCLRFKAK